MIDSDPYSSAKSGIMPQGQAAICKPTVCLKYMSKVYHKIIKVNQTTIHSKLAEKFTNNKTQPDLRLFTKLCLVTECEDFT